MSNATEEIATRLEHKVNPTISLHLITVASIIIELHKTLSPRTKNGKNVTAIRMEWGCLLFLPLFWN